MTTGTARRRPRRRIAYLPKTAGADQVVAAVRAAAPGESVLDPGRRPARPPAPRGQDRDRPLDRPSPRELQVWPTCPAAAPTARSPSASIGEQTVKSYVSSILAKLQLQDRTQAAIFGLQQGLVPLDQALDD